MLVDYLRRSEVMVTIIEQDFSKSASGRCTVSASTIRDDTKSEILDVITIEAETRLYEE